MIGTIASIGASAAMASVSALGAGGDTAATKGSRHAGRPDPLKDIFAALDTNATGGTSSGETKSFVDTLSTGTRSALLSVQEKASSSTASTSSSTLDEALAEVVAAMDQNGDRAITESELDAWIKANAPPQAEGASGERASKSGGYDPLDTNRDGVVSQTELSAHLDQMAASLQSNGGTASSSSSSGFASMLAQLLQSYQRGTAADAVSIGAAVSLDTAA